MFDELVKRGYRVQPQVPCGGYRIDLVVEGNEGRRLAVECDGDRFLGPGQWSADTARQRVLERAGWTFWRCFASSFVRRREAVVGELLQTLGRLGLKATTDVRSLNRLSHELQFRQVPRAIAPLEKVEKALAGSRVAPTAPPFSGSNAAPATVPSAGPVAPVQQADLWGTASADRAIVAPRVVMPPLAARPVPAASVTPPQKAPPSPSASTLSVDEAHKVLKATPDSTWESIEQTRRQLVQLAHPYHLAALREEKRPPVIAEAKRANAA